MWSVIVRRATNRDGRWVVHNGTVELNAPRVNDRRRDEHGHRHRFTSRILPPYMRRSHKVAEVLPILYLRGLSTGDFRPGQLQALLSSHQPKSRAWTPIQLRRDR
jgi:putative transposase